MTSSSAIKSIGFGILASSLLLGLYFAVLSLISGWDFALDQFVSFRIYIVSLAVGFGIQVGLFTYLRNLVHGAQGSGKVLGVTGATSTVTMVSCCAHYLVNLLPVLGVTGAVTFISQYQIELFWLGLIFNIGGIIYIARKIVQFSTREALLNAEQTRIL